jgi:hypothetical protein
MKILPNNFDCFSIKFLLSFIFVLIHSLKSKKIIDKFRAERNGYQESFRCNVWLSHVQESELFKFAWNMEACGRSSCWIEGQEACGFVCCIVNSENVGVK